MLICTNDIFRELSISLLGRRSYLIVAFEPFHFEQQPRIMLLVLLLLAVGT